MVQIKLYRINSLFKRTEFIILFEKFEQVLYVVKVSMSAISRLIFYYH